MGEGLTSELVCCRRGIGRPLVALTFDDGPSEWTPAVLETLERHSVLGTFFVVGRYVEALPAIVARTAAAGHELGNHTFDHVDPGHEKDEDVLRDQLARTSAAIEAAAGVRTTLVRPPYGKDPCRVSRLGAEIGLERTVLWSVQAWDWAAPPADEIVSEVLGQAHRGAIVLLHDGAPPGDNSSREGTVEAVARIVPALLEQGYEFRTVSDLLAAGSS